MKFKITINENSDKWDRVKATLRKNIDISFREEDDTQLKSGEVFLVSVNRVPNNRYRFITVYDVDGKRLGKFEAVNVEDYFKKV